MREVTLVNVASEASHRGKMAHSEGDPLEIAALISHFCQPGQMEAVFSRKAPWKECGRYPPYCVLGRKDIFFRRNQTNHNCSTTTNCKSQLRSSQNSALLVVSLSGRNHMPLSRYPWYFPGKEFMPYVPISDLSSRRTPKWFFWRLCSSQRPGRWHPQV